MQTERRLRRPACVSAEWREGSAVKLPLADATFNPGVLPAGPAIFFRSIRHTARDVPNISAKWALGAERLARNRAKPGFCRASRCVDASYNTGFL